MGVSERPIVVWFERALRLADHPALHAAAAQGRPVVPVYVWRDSEGEFAPGAATQWWLHHSLQALGEQLTEQGSRLIIRRGSVVEALLAVAAAVDAEAVYWTRGYEPDVRREEAALRQALSQAGRTARRFAGSLLHEPDEVSNQQGGPFKVFTPFWRSCLNREVAAPKPPPHGKLNGPAEWPATVPLEELKLLPTLPWADAFPEHWTPGEAGAQRALHRFVAAAMQAYGDERDLPDRVGTSRLSPHLHFGEISPRQIWAAVADSGRERGVFPPNRGAQIFLSEVGWREFAHHLLYHFPSTTTAPLRAEFARFPWREDPDDRLLKAWQRGHTGYPIVDAGMRELWTTGWMHNRVRMVVASFLVKHLRLPWQRGAAWFWDTLVDADLANNTLGWQWTAGCGADAAPYFRVFNPMLQGAKFDREGEYVRRWVPELAKLPNQHLHCPWEAPMDILAEAEVTLGKTYPHPLVDHGTSRAEALAAYQELKREA